MSKKIRRKVRSKATPLHTAPSIRQVTDRHGPGYLPGRYIIGIANCQGYHATINRFKNNELPSVIWRALRVSNVNDYAFLLLQPIAGESKEDIYITRTNLAADYTADSWLVASKAQAKAVWKKMPYRYEDV